MLLRSALAISVLVQFSSSDSIIESGCKGPGVLPHPYDCTQFLICADDHGKVFVAETVPCPEGYIFSASEKTCVRGEQCRPASLPTKSRERRATVAGACKASGPYCEDCDRLVICANMGQHVLTALTNISCSEINPEMSCHKATCTTEAAATQSCEGSEQAGTFRCLQPGLFPDPADCKLYHVCGSDLSHFSGECDKEFDADLGTCTSEDPDDKHLEAPAKTSPAGECSNIENQCKGVKTAPVKFPKYPSYYVICIPVATKSRKFSHFYQVSVAKCPGRQVFNDEKVACEMTCSGKRGRFQDPDNCRSYIECSGAEPVKKSCRENFAFDADRKLCLPESMVPGCQRTRAVETSTPIVTTTTQTTNLTSISTTTKSIPSVGFQCLASGAFPDESDCHWYITCTLETRKEGVYFRMGRKRCPFLTYFNPGGFCEFGLCWN